MSLAFTTPWLLWALAGLPLLWLLLRAVPPAAIRRRFPGVALLAGLADRDRQAARTPWWLLALRLAAAALVILGFAGPVLNPQSGASFDRPLLVLVDGSWTAAQDWQAQLDQAADVLARAGRAGRAVALVRLTDPPQATGFQAADALAGRVQALPPQPWLPDDAAWARALPDGEFDSYWLSDGVQRPGRAALVQALQARGSVSVFQTGQPLVALRPLRLAEGALQITALRLDGGAAQEVTVLALGPDPAGQVRDLARGLVRFAPGATEATLALPLPPELRNRITRVEVAGARHAGAVSLADDSLRRRKVALIAEGTGQEGLALLSQTHYLRQALVPLAEVMEGSIADVLPAGPDVIVLADVARLTEAEAAGLQDWVAKGGLLLRFAGPRLAASDLGRSGEDPLLPVRLREGGRSLGGAMSWDKPKPLAAFAEGSPFHGLALPGDVTVSAQVLAQPDPDLAARSIATLADGTPLVTRRLLGQGQVVLFHVTANAEWSNLPLSGLFVQMLERLAVSTRPAQPQAADLQGQTWTAERLLDAQGRETRADGLAGVDGAALGRGLAEGPGGALPPGLYAGQERRVALNVVTSDARLLPQPWPADIIVEAPGGRAERALQGPVLAAALLALCLDILATLALSGRLAWRLRDRGAGVAVLALAVALAAGGGQRAQAETAEERAIAATAGVILAYVETGDPAVDALSRAGLAGLSDQLWYRTAVEPLAPMGVDVEVDELAFFPFLYWPVTAEAEPPSAAAFAKLNQFLRSGGMILFDTADGDLAQGGAITPEGQALQRIAAGLDIPPLAPLDPDHVLTRSFYLLSDFPGRFAGTSVWAEAPPPDAEQAEGMPFRNLNDGVTPVLIGGNDWAAAWAVDENGLPLRPVGRGAAGEEQREYAYRFGINLIMHVLTGNYKSDQVHVPALLERLGE